MQNNIFHVIKKEESILYFLGWSTVALLSIFGNTSIGLILLIFHELCALKHKKRLSFEISQQIHSLIIIFLIWSFITSFFSYNKTLAFSGTLGFTLVIYISFWGAAKLLKYKYFFNNLFIPLITVSSLLSSLYVIFTYYFYNLKRGMTLLSGINGTGTLFVFSIFIILGNFDYYKNNKQQFSNTGYFLYKYRKLLLIPFFSSIIALILTFSRGAFIGFLVGFTFYSLRSRKNFLILLITILLLSSFFMISPQFRGRLMSIFSLEANNNRIQIWISTIDIIKDHPVWGVGPGNFSVVYPDYKTPEARESNHPYSHNIFSNMAAEMGVPGLFLFALIILRLLKMGYVISRINTLYRGLFTAFIGVMIHQQFDCIILGMEIGALFWLVAGLITAFYYREKVSIIHNS